MTDNTQSWILQTDGTYVRSSPTGNQLARSAQSTLLEKLASSPQRAVNV
jgi:polyphosphate kinase